MNKPRKHRKEIIAWADGAEIQRLVRGTWLVPDTWYDDCDPTWSEENLYRVKPKTVCTLDMQEAADEIERLRAQNETLMTAIAATAALMASAPAWHAMHREAIAELQRVKKEVES